MTTLYKLTTQDNKTRKGYSNETVWGENVTHSGTGEGDLCGPGYIHAYTSPLLAVLLNPIHVKITNPKLWIADGEVIKNDRGLKVGCKSLTTINEIAVPEISITQKVAFAILCTKEVHKNAKWNEWADKWLSGEDRSHDAAYAAADADADADAAAYAAYAVAYAAADAAAAEIDLIKIAEQAMLVK